MPTRPNPLKLNPLQLRTLAILQQLARSSGFAEAPDADGTVLIRGLPRAHGDHFHVGDAVVLAKDATGLANAAVFGALVRKGLLLAGPSGMPVMTRDGIAYETGVAEAVLHRTDH